MATREQQRRRKAMKLALRLLPEERRLLRNALKPWIMASNKEKMETLNLTNALLDRVETPFDRFEYEN